MRECGDNPRKAFFPISVVLYLAVACTAYAQPRSIADANVDYSDKAPIGVCTEKGETPVAEQALRLVCLRNSGRTEVIAVRNAIVIGFVGGFVKRDDTTHPEVQFAAYLRERYAGVVQVELFTNHEGNKALSEVLNLLDTNRDGKLTNSEKEQANIIIFGHSWGASEAVTLARELGRRGVPVLLTIQVDSVAKPGEDDSSIPSNVFCAVNFYQTKGLLRGCSRIRAVDPERTKILGNFHMTPYDRDISHDRYPWPVRMLAKPHIQLENDPGVWDSIATLIDSQLLTPQSASQILAIR